MHSRAQARSSNQQQRQWCHIDVVWLVCSKYGSSAGLVVFSGIVSTVRGTVVVAEVTTKQAVVNYIDIT